MACAQIGPRDPAPPSHSKTSSRESPPAFALVAGSAGYLDELVNQGLAYPARDVLVDRLHGLAHGGILLGRQCNDLGLAGLLDLGQSFVVFLRRLTVAVGGGFFHGLFELGTNISGKTVPELLVGDHDVANVAVIGDGC